MNAKELMVGDWVMKDDGPRQVRNHTTTVDGEPIIITRDIIEKSGLKSTAYYDTNTYPLKDSGIYIVYNGPGNVDLCVQYECPDEGCFHLQRITTVNWVHQLQHFLNLCDIQLQIKI